jgi:hypothetical protein
LVKLFLFSSADICVSHIALIAKGSKLVLDITFVCSHLLLDLRFPIFIHSQAWITLIGEKLEATLAKYVTNERLAVQDRV